VVLVAGGLLVVALGISLALGRWKNPFKKIDVPKRLGIEIQQESNGVTYRHTFGSHAVFQIHASKVVQLRNNHAMLHDVKIELYEPDGGRVDRIEGAEFEYDQAEQVAKAAGPVEITIMRPAAAAKPGSTQPIAAASGGEIHIKTSGVEFDQKTGIAATSERVDFAVTQGAGSAVGARYESADGRLILDHQVTLNMRRNGQTVELHAQHGEFERGDLVCNLRGATAGYRGGEANAGAAKILFREDGSAVRLDATDGFAVASANGGHLSAPLGWLEFSENNQPKHAHLEGGVTMDSVTSSEKGSRDAHGSAPSAELDFTAAGELRHAHLERGVEFATREQTLEPAGPVVVSRAWRSPVADVEFRKAGAKAEPVWLHGAGGVVVNGETRRGNGAAMPSRLAADEMTIDFGPNSTPRELKGTGRAGIEQTTSSGTRESGTGDRLEARFSQPATASAPERTDSTKRLAVENHGKPAGGVAQIEEATLDGHVVMDQTAVAKQGEAAGTAMHATAGRADYEGAGEWIHLIESPRVDDGGLQLSADRIDVSQASGDAFAHGNVKATWLGPDAENRTKSGSQGGDSSSGQRNAVLGGQGPSHLVAAEAQLHQASAEAAFRGDARLWQQANSVSAPVIVLNRQKQTLAASTTERDHPVRVVMVSSAGLAPGKQPPKNGGDKPHGQSVIRVTGGTLKYSEAERKAVMTGGAVGGVLAETEWARSISDRVELILLPPGNHAGRDGEAAQVDKMTASGHVTVTSQNRRGTGSQLVYTAETGDYVLSGTAGAPPKMTDPAHGEVTGEALIFHSRDDSVSIEGGGGKTLTETRSPK